MMKFKKLLLLLLTRTVVRMKPGDVLVLKVDDGAVLPQVEWDALDENLRAAFPDNKTLVLEGVSIHRVVSQKEGSERLWTY